MASRKHSPEQIRKVAHNIALTAVGVGSAVLLVTDPKFRRAVVEALNLPDKLPSSSNASRSTSGSQARPPQAQTKTNAPVSGAPIPGAPIPGGDGVVYLLKAGPFYKVGKAQDFEKRSRRIKLQMPFPIEDVHTIACRDISHVERYWHNRFGARRANSEWFLLTDADVEEFKSYEKM